MLGIRSASRGFRKVSLACASLAVVLGLMTFLGWISAMPLLASIRAKYIPMAPSTALCFSLIGGGLLLHLRRPSWRGGGQAVSGAGAGHGRRQTG